MKNLIYIISLILVLSVVTVCSSDKKKDAKFSCECEISEKTETISADNIPKAEKLCTAKNGKINKCSTK